MCLSDIPIQHMQTLTQILQLRPNEDPLTYSKRVLGLIRVLPSGFKRPNRLSRLLLPSQRPSTFLCVLHKALHGPLVHSLFTLITLEVGIRLNSLVSHSGRLAAAQISRVHGLRELHALWLPPDVYEKMFLASPSGLKWRYQEDECEACMLARMSGDLDTLLNLRLILLSRTTKRFVAKHGQPRLRRWIEAWIASLATSIPELGVRDDDDHWEKMIHQNDEDAKELKKIRSGIIKDRRRKRNHPTDSKGPNGSLRTAVVDNVAATLVAIRESDSPHTSGKLKEEMGMTNEDGKDDDHLAYALENEIIDQYAASWSTRSLPKGKTAHRRGSCPMTGNEDMSQQWMEHNASSKSVATARGVTNGENGCQYPYADRLQRMPDMESVYSIDTVRKRRCSRERVMPGYRARQFSDIQMDVYRDECILPTDVWEGKEPGALMGEPDVIQTSPTDQGQNEHAKWYQYLLDDPYSVSAANTCDSWETVPIPSTEPSRTQLVLNLRGLEPDLST